MHIRADSLPAGRILQFGVARVRRRRLCVVRRVQIMLSHNAGAGEAVECHGGCINLYYQNVIPSPYTKWYHKSCYIIVWVLMEIVYSIFIGMIPSKIVGMINGIVLQCRRDSHH